MAEQTLKEKTAKGLFWGGISYGIQTFLNLVFGLVLARILNADDYGMVGMLAIFSAVASTIQESGFTAALTNRKKFCDDDYNAVFWFSTLSGLFFYILLFFCAPLIAHFYHRPELVKLSRILFLCFLFGGLGIASNAYLFKSLMTKERARVDIFSTILSGSIGVYLALHGYAYIGLAIQMVISSALSSVFKLYYSPWHPSFHFNFQPLKEMFSFSFKLILTNFVIQINNNVFSVVLGKFFNATQLGFYAQGQKWMGMGNQLITGMINNVAQPVLVQVNDDSERQCAVFRKMVRFGAFISFPAMLGLAFVAKEFIVILLGTKWLPSVPFLQLFCLWGAIVYMWVLYTNLMMTHGKSNLYLYGMILTGVLQILAIISLFRLGIYVMVIGYILSYYVSMFYWQYFANKILHVKLFHILKDMFPYLGAMIISVLAGYFASYLFSNVYIILVTKIFITALFYIAIIKTFNSTVFNDVLSFVLKRMHN